MIYKHISYLSKILFLLGSFKKEIPRIFVLFFIACLLDIAGIAIVVKIFSVFTSSDVNEILLLKYFNQFFEEINFQDIIILMSVVLVILYFFRFLMALFINFVILDFCGRVSSELRYKLFKSYISMPLLKFISKDSGEYLDTMHRRVAQFAQTTLFSLLRTISDLIIISSLLIFMSISFPEGILIITFIGGILLTSYLLILGPLVNNIGKLCNRYAANLMQLFKEALTGKKEIFVLNKEDEFANEIEKRAVDFAKANRNSLFLTMSPKYVIEFLLVFTLIFMFSIIFLFPNKQSYLIPFFSGLSVAAIRIVPSSYQLITSLLNLQFTRPSVEDLVREIKFLASIVTKSKKVKHITCSDFKTLEIKNLSFRYEKQNKNVLNNINLLIKKNSMITIIGESGSGKSTLFDIMIGLIKPKIGKLLVNGKPLEKFGINWTHKIAYCPQKPFIFKDLLHKNVSLDFKDVRKNKLHSEDLKIQNALNNAQLKLMIDKEITDGGTNISGGQMQRVGLARMFHSDREVLFLDEPTSALDKKNEEKVFMQLKKISQNKTIIIASHSEIALKLSDEVYSISNGYVIKTKSIMNEIS